MVVKVETFECGCKRKLYCNNGNVEMVEWVEWCDEHRKTIRKKL